MLGKIYKYISPLVQKASLSTIQHRVAIVEELYVRRDLFPGEEPAFMDVSEDEVLRMAENLAGGIQIPTIRGSIQLNFLTFYNRIVI